MDWFRVYHSILDKPKFAKLDWQTIGAWTLLAAAASRGSPRGTIPEDIDELSLMTHRPAEELRKFIARLVEAGLLERRPDGRIGFYKWTDYQPPSTERTRKHKDAAKERGGTGGNTDPPRPSREQKEHREQKERAGTSGNGRNAGNGERGERLEEIPQPPLDQTAQEGEPFIPPPSEAKPLSPEAARMVTRVDACFPGYGYGELCGQRGMVPEAAIPAAEDCRDRGKMSWPYFVKVYETKAKEFAAAPVRAAPRMLLDFPNGPDPADTARMRERNRKLVEQAQARRANAAS